MKIEFIKGYLNGMRDAAQAFDKLIIELEEDGKEERN